ncbi:hypothetical protein PLESTB_001256800 [Pleodorina starrii]|uniref:Uncharacterized protein n=1 Tax=Pleodorina starrii TaxID=330485 RepID=A0A9W6BT33_9CHLO|nr:hypothetical protein PLESTM_000203100 [Pleodorina starrii]GLC57714.1 hypothetical protein PLESTB_001256800 [Pleodorina starrii]GLC63384.1 hypothetical protein PLESTF_000030600 [Pleodorina starrii]
MDLTGLSQEEAALITDVLTRLSIGGTAATSIVPQGTPAYGVIQDPALMELDMAAWTLEQELRGLNSTPSLGSQYERYPREPFGHANSPYQGSVTSGDPYQADAYYGAVESPVLYGGAAAGSGRWPQEPMTPSQAATLAVPPSRAVPGSDTVQQPQAVHAVANVTLQPDGLGAGAVPTIWAHNQQVTGAADPGPSVEEPVSDGARSSASPAPPQPMSLLKEMRERLRQQQSQQLAAGGPVDASGTSASTANGSMATGAGFKASAEAQLGHEPRTRAASVSPMGSPSSVAANRVRRSTLPPPELAAKAFTMLNARTNVERYGSDSAQADEQAATPTKPPVKLPESERSARLQQLYERTANWKRRCDERYAKERHDRVASEMEECTFTPKITRTSVLIMQGKSPSEVYSVLSKGSTPTKHQRSTSTTPVRTAPGAAAAGNRSPSVGSTPTDSRAGGGRSTAPAPGQAGSGDDSASGAAGSSSPSRPVASNAQVCERLYQRAFEQRARQEARYFRQLLEEERQRRFTASVQDATPRVFNTPEPPTSRFLPTGMEECTFQPSSYAGSNRRPKSAPHMRSGGEGRARARSMGASPLFNIYGPTGPPSRGLTTAQTLSHGPRPSGISFGPDLDWEEFLARQERFLALREQKLQQLDQTEPPAPRMARGSIKLLREREMRKSFMAAAAEASGQADVQGEASSRTAGSSPGPQGRRVKTIMEMYKECTFQPQITRRASARPSRHLEEIVDGGRSRREEWRQQQLALQQAREAENLTFKPRLVAKDAYTHVRPRISMKNPDAYLAHVADKRRQREALRAELDSEREALELQQCTFKPQTTPLPTYLIRRLQEQHLQQLLQAEGTGQSIAWEESSGGLGDIDEGVKSSDDLYADAGQEQPPEFQPFQSGQAGNPPADQAADALGAESNPYQEAYQRALQFAASLGQSSS